MERKAGIEQCKRIKGTENKAEAATLLSGVVRGWGAHCEREWRLNKSWSEEIATGIRGKSCSSAKALRGRFA